MTAFDRFDHELSLLSATAYFILIGYAGYIIVALQLALFFPSTRKSRFFPETSRYHVGSIIVLLLLAIELPLIVLSPADGLADLLVGQNPKLNEILAKVPAIQQGPAPPLFFRNRHVQFFPWLIQNEVHRQQGVPFERIHFNVTDCLNKMRDCDGIGPLSHYMNDTVTLDVFPPFDEDSPWSKNFSKSSPVIFMTPGLRCYSQDIPGTMIVRKAFQYGFRSIVVNRRGHTPDQLLKSPRWNLFGDVDDMEQVYWYVKRELVAPNTPLFLHGVSSGTSITVSGLSKWDKRHRDEPEREAPSFVAFTGITPGYDISKVMRRDRFMWPYNDILLHGVKDHFIVKNEEILRKFDSDAVDRALAATSLQGVVDASVTFAGYDDLAAYYADSNPINNVTSIDTPTLILNSVDDPCCKIQNLYEESPYPEHEGKTYANMIQESQNGMVAVTFTGSHCPFLCSRDKWLPVVEDPLTGGWMLQSWADQVVIEYFLAALEVYGERRFL